MESTIHAASEPATQESLPVQNDTKSNPKVPKTTKKQKKKGSKNPSTITPEYIAEQRALREQKKEAKRQELIAQGIDPDQIDTPADLRFIKRPLLKISETISTFNDEMGLNIKIMTYNLLAQALIRRKLFPTSGNALKWFKRSKVLLAELHHYNADIMCLQEVDFTQFNSFWKIEFEKIGYLTKYHRADSKNHGICIVYRKDLFKLIETGFIDYDKEKSGDIFPRTTTRNVGLLTALEFTQEVKARYPGMKKSGVIIGTTHLFWHPFGTFERTRQTYLVMKKSKEFQHVINTIYNKGEDDKWFNFFAGDFNSQPFDSPYLSITSKPITYTGRAKTVLGCSLSYEYSKSRGLEEEEDDEEHEDDDSKETSVVEEEEEEEGGNVEKYGSNQPTDPVPEFFEMTEEHSKLVLQMQALHNDLEVRAISLYSLGYKQIHPTNSGRDNERNEPCFSNWAHTWRGLLDYIFLVKPWDKIVENKHIESLEDFGNENKVKVNGLLRLPEPEEMGEEPSGQPREGQYPSDHLCLVADLTLDLS